MNRVRRVTIHVTFFLVIQAGWLLSTNSDCLVAQKPLQVFILAGQSNMQGHAQVRTLEHLAMDQDSLPLLNAIQDDRGKAIVHEKVWISYLSSAGIKTGQLTTGFGADENKIGPELTFGIYLQKTLEEPILIIKTAWGGKSVHTDFRSPSAGPYKFSEQQLLQFENQGKDLAQIKADRVEATGHYYRLMLEHIQATLSDIPQTYPEYDVDQGYELAGFVWFQGWNDMVDRGVYPNRDQQGGYDQYTDVLGHFIRDVRKELDAPKLPFVIGVMGIGGPTSDYLPDQHRYRGIHQNFRDAMAAVAKQDEFQGNVVNVLTENFWDPELTFLRARESKLKQEMKKLREESELSNEDAKAMLEKLRDQEFSEREQKILTTATSNAEYHYLGSGKIMARIGKGFAEALAEAKK